MKKEDLREKVLETMQSDNCHEHYENLAEACFDSINTVDEPYHKIGYNLLKAYLEGDVDGAITAICGWSLSTLMVKAGIIPDIEGVFSSPKESIIRFIARDIVDEGTSNTSSGNWIVYFDEIQEKYNLNLSENKEMLAAIVKEMNDSFAEKIAEISVTEDAIDVTYYLDFCPNAEE